jgi:hypothetical protein
MAIPFCPGDASEPFATLVRDYPGNSAYPTSGFRTEWGPVFHRGRLDGTARILAVGQDPAQHETVVRRILIGKAGRRVQGFLAKLGVKSSYVVINTFLYGVYGQANGASYIGAAPITAYRNRWIKAILDTQPIEAVIAFGSLADQAWTAWLASPAAQGRPAIAFQHVSHPTYPDSVGKDDKPKVAALTRQMLVGWNTALAALKPAILHPDGSFGAAYGNTFKSPSFRIFHRQTCRPARRRGWERKRTGRSAEPPRPP